MKTHDEIKKGLAGCNARRCAKDCPYGDTIPCVMMMHKDACEYVQQLEAQVPKWISVEERLPEGECLAGCFAHGSYGYGEYIIGYVAPYSESEGSEYCAENSFVLLDDVTHWMPLPEPPKEDEDE